jgi:pyruvate kinase
MNNVAPRRKTKIIATVGPASRSPERLKELILAGANVFRLNFSHGSPAEHLEVLENVRSISREVDIPVGVLQDLSGPKIRITNVDGDYAVIPDGSTVELVHAPKGSVAAPLSNSSRIYVETVNPSEVLKPGHNVLLADGIIVLVATSVEGDVVRCSINKGGRIRSRVGIAFPDSAINLPAATEKDMRDLEWGISHGVDFVAVSFVQNAQDLLMLREVVRRGNSPIQLIAKIERRTALENIEEILDAADGLMVARGDLGLELPLEQVPLVQRRLIEQANFRGIPVIVATQMLHSMITSVRPTRAEVTDVAFAVMSGTDAVMLSEETAIGEHPIECVRYLGKVAQEAEKSFEFEEFKLRLRDSDRLTVPDAISYAACAAAVKVNASAIIACSHTGSSARLVAKYRPQQPLFGVSTEQPALQRMAILWGVVPVRLPPTEGGSNEIDIALTTLQARFAFPRGARAVVIGGMSAKSPGSTSQLQLREFGGPPA